MEYARTHGQLVVSALTIFTICLLSMDGCDVVNGDVWGCGWLERKAHKVVLDFEKIRIRTREVGVPFEFIATCSKS